jgi:ribulose kinase
MTTTTQNLARYETAQEAIGKLIAHLSALAYKEERLPTPNAVKLAQWRVEQSQLMEEDAQLFFGDTQNIERVIAVYGPRCKAIYGA